MNEFSCNFLCITLQHANRPAKTTAAVPAKKKFLLNSLRVHSFIKLSIAKICDKNSYITRGFNVFFPRFFLQVNICYVYETRLV